MKKLALIILIVTGILTACRPTEAKLGEESALSEAAIPIHTPTPNETPEPKSTPETSATTAFDVSAFQTSLAQAVISPNSDQSDDEPACIKWSNVSADQAGETICVYGIIYSLDQSRQTWTRYKFSDEPNTFFIFSKNYEYYDPNTGKTIGPDTCIFIEGKIELIESIPFINIENAESFRFSTRKADCN